MNITCKLTTHSLLTILLGLSVFSAPPLSAIADEVQNRSLSQRTLPSSPSSAFQATGFAGKLNGANRSIIISGTRYYYGINTKVHTQSSNLASASAIKKGDELGFSYVEDTKRKRFLSEVWILPAGSLTGS